MIASLQRSYRLLIFSVLIFGSCLTYVWAASAFKVREIQVRGNQKVKIETILNYLPIKINQQLATDQFPALINRLYQTDFFDKVSLAREGDSLVVTVQERPTINDINFTGNHLVNKEKFDEILKQEGLTRGHLFNQSILESIKKSLKQTYLEQGYYNIHLETELRALPRNRVSVQLKIYEGEKVRVRSIKIIGNKAFSERQLISEFSMTTPKPWSFLTNGDKYSRERLDNDVRALREFYMDHGYLQVKIVAKQATLTPDRNWVHLVLAVDEGHIYHVRGYGFLGNLLGAQKTLHEFVDLQPASTYAYAKVTEISQRISSYYANKGYALVHVEVVPNIDEKQHLVFLNFYVEPGHRTYVRRIHFSGNNSTNSDVLRREMRQMEGGLFSEGQIKESLRRLRNLVYVRDARLETVPVMGATDQVDLNIHVEEVPSAEMMVQVGYGTNGFLYGARLHQQNLWGTGRAVSLQFNRDLYQKSYSVQYQNPYFTDNGVSQSYSAYASKTTPGRMNITNYRYDTVGLGTTFGIPLSDYDTLDLGLKVENIDLTLGDSPSQELVDFTQQHGSSFDHSIWSAYWTHSHYDRQPFPTEGLYQSLGIQVSTPLNKKQLSYYKLTYMGHWYIPLTRAFTLSLYGHMGYEQGLFRNRDRLPFLVNFYAGGIGTMGSVRGYEQNTLGPRDSKGEAIGGNVVTNGTVALIFPNGISENLRTSLFVDGGNVYDSKSSTGIDLGSLRYSAGVNIALHVPQIGSLQLSWAKALNKRSGDEVDALQFTFGTSFNS